MNIDNLKRMVEHLKTIKDDQLDMATYNRRAKHITVSSFIVSNFECATAGCVIGHSVRLDTELMKKVITDAGNFSGIPRLYTAWSEEFTGLIYDSIRWQWCFSGGWKQYDNTVKGAISRIESLIDDTWREHEHYQRFLERQM